MRLLIVTNDYPPEPGGIQMYLRNLVDAYPDAVHVVGPADANADPSEEGITRGERSYMLPTAATGALVVDAARKFNPDAILFGAPHPLPFLTGRLRRELEIPIGVISYGAEITIPAAVPGLRQVLGRGLAAADVRFALSGFVAERVHRMTGKPVEVLGAGVEIDTFTPPPSPPVNDVPVVGCVSRFVPRKGQARLLEAAAR
ncbi:MAG: glycosyltransferase, partial [Actinomycetota bacterium]